MDGIILSEYHKRELHKRSFKNIAVVELPFNTGKVDNQSFYGHRIYAGFSQLVNADYVFFLDEDNWFDNFHVESLIDLLESRKELDFAYSLRGIYNKDRDFLINDNCESLGRWPIWCTPTDKLQYLIDTSSFCFRHNFIRDTGCLWNSGWGGDRRYLSLVADNAKFDTTGKHTLCYRLDGNPNSVTEEFFIEGNRSVTNSYKKLNSTHFPWGEPLPL